ncbi:hypothetical protein SteCoe_2148 [Stentor coeruleus]|uniref:Cytochrome b5 heme-binding domain-containing protein n=1 Tax=Stentor coeruleus TaxID=5963 RepID=A0A1R2D080_9CILI|nr:hypothetical protein SteCoe_2148 [Stentor coeruleus]
MEKNSPESENQYIEFIYGKRYIKLRWNPETTTEDMIMDAIDGIGRKLIEYFSASFINFVNDRGRVVYIDAIASEIISPVFIRAPDAKKNLISTEIIIQDLKCCKFDRKQFFIIKNSKLVEENFIELKEITWSEITKHTKRKDCWMVLYNKVYNVTDYIKKHPGGDVIFKSVGKDATLLFNKHHPWVNPETAMKGLCIGIAK